MLPPYWMIYHQWQLQNTIKSLQDRGLNPTFSNEKPCIFGSIRSSRSGPLCLSVRVISDKHSLLSLLSIWALTQAHTSSDRWNLKYLVLLTFGVCCISDFNITEFTGLNLFWCFLILKCESSSPTGQYNFIAS